AMELAKREAETEELNKKKKMVKEESIEDILNDAVKQAEDKINHNAEHVDQNDLDALIAMELAKREAETEEMIRRKKEAEKKNNLVDGIDLEKKNEPLTEEPSKTETKATSLVVEVDSIAEIRELAKKIIKGEEKDISIDIKGELGEIIRLIQNTKSKVDSLEPNLEKSTETVPTVSKTLEFVNNTTEEATYNLIQHCDELSSLYSELSERFREVEKLLESQNRDATLQKIEEIEELISKAEELGFNILQALEFQDITEQKINKVIKNVEEIGARLGSILGYVVATKGLDEEGEKASQDDIEKLLSDFGLN
ncbi:MAG: protein phosphatase CheZ, partial [Deferribacterales bacterium]